MSTSFGADPGGASQDFDLNLAPIIDCFTVLIAFMLASASFLAIGIFDAGAAASSAANSGQPPAIRIEAQLDMNKTIDLHVEGKVNLRKKIPPRDGTYDRAALIAEIGELRNRFPDTKGMVLRAEDDVEYAEIIAAMEGLKKKIPSVMLGGL
jgi:biopolymer transport protein ExbD